MSCWSTAQVGFEPASDKEALLNLSQAASLGLANRALTGRATTFARRGWAESLSILFLCTGKALKFFSGKRFWPLPGKDGKDTQGGGPPAC